jgi:hypothetical protein
MKNRPCVVETGEGFMRFELPAGDRNAKTLHCGTAQFCRLDPFRGSCYFASDNPTLIYPFGIMKKDSCRDLL